MKKFILVVIAIFLISGCGDSSKQQSQPSQASVQTAGLGNEQEQDRLIAQGSNYINQGDVPSAIRSFDEAIKRDPRDVKGYLVLGETYLRLKSYDRAVDTFAAALAFEPDNGQLNYLIAVALNLQGGKEAEALEHAQRSVVIFRAKEDEENFIKSVALMQALMETAKDK